MCRLNATWLLKLECVNVYGNCVCITTISEIFGIVKYMPTIVVEYFLTENLQSVSADKICQH